MNPEAKAILEALLESRKILEAKLEAMDTKLKTMDAKLETMDAKLETMDAKLETMDAKLETVASDVGLIKEQVSDLTARDKYLTQKTGELEAELFVVKRRQKA